MLRLCPPAGMVSTARIVNDGGEYTFQVLLRTIEMGISSVNDFLSVCEKISKSGNYKILSGNESGGDQCRGGSRGGSIGSDEPPFLTSLAV